jgi:asparagine synthase (glutamine-hydrolysing)
VALSGDGGDENFAGYGSYAAVAAWGPVDAVPFTLRQAATSPLRKALSALPFNNTIARGRRALAMLGAQLPDRFRLQISTFKPEEKAALYTDRFRALALPAVEPLSLDWNPRMDSLAWMMRHDQTFYLPDCLMVKVDIASMANSLEVRAPLLDHHFMEFTASIPSSMKVRGGVTKAIFRNAVRTLVPEPVLTKRKTGFGPPVARWCRNELLPMLRDVLLDDRAAARGLFNQSFVKLLIEQHASGRRDWSNRLWALLFLELWFRRHIDSPRARPALELAAAV